MARNLWKQVLCRLNLTDDIPARSRRQRLSFDTEPLEIRLVLAVTVTFQNGNLSIVGDNAGNQINLTRQANGNLVVSANLRSIPSAAHRLSTMLPRSRLTAKVATTRYHSDRNWRLVTPRDNQRWQRQRHHSRRIRG